ncbi:MAG: hypothetical protein R2941_11575 [Desulfobacterales bacterium]
MEEIVFDEDESDNHTKGKMTQNFNMTNYEKIFNEFRHEVPEYFNFAADVIDKWAEDPKKLAIWWVDDAGNEIRKPFWI